MVYPLDQTTSPDGRVCVSVAVMCGADVRRVRKTQITFESLSLKTPSSEDASLVVFIKALFPLQRPITYVIGLVSLKVTIIVL